MVKQFIVKMCGKQDRDKTITHRVNTNGEFSARCIAESIWGGVYEIVNITEG